MLPPPLQDDPLKTSMHSFLMSGQNVQEIGMLDNKVRTCQQCATGVATLLCHSLQIHETVEQINGIKLQREFYLGFSDNPQKFINDWLASQNRDLKVSVHSAWSEGRVLFDNVCNLRLWSCDRSGDEGPDGQHRI